jgi:tetratricopeptide (TPR) repeat protein
MRGLLPLAASVAVFLLAVPAEGNDKRDCAEHKDQDHRMTACSKVIAQAPKDAAAYHNRGEARARKGDVDNAIADYSKAIEINPGFARALDSRGRAYASKGDYTRAVHDVTKARELAVAKMPAAKKAAEQAPPKKPAAAAPSKAIAKAAPENLWPAWARTTD